MMSDDKTDLKSTKPERSLKIYFKVLQKESYRSIRSGVYLFKEGTGRGYIKYEILNFDFRFD